MKCPKCGSTHIVRDASGNCAEDVTYACAKCGYWSYNRPEFEVKV